jgi:hypothetical protein
MAIPIIGLEPEIMDELGCSASMAAQNGWNGSEMDHRFGLRDTGRPQPELPARACSG